MMVTFGVSLMVELFHPSLRYLHKLVSHPSLLQDPDLREFLEKEEVRVISVANLSYTPWSKVCGHSIVLGRFSARF